MPVDFGFLPPSFLRLHWSVPVVCAASRAHPPFAYSDAFWWLLEYRTRLLGWDLFPQVAWPSPLRECGHRPSCDYIPPRPPPECGMMELFRESLPDLCLSKVAAGEQVEEFKALLQKLRRWANTPEGERLDIPRAKNTPILFLAESLAGQQVRRGKLPCPAHADHTPSLHIYEDGNRFKCFSCQRSGDQIDLLRLYTNCTLPEAVRRLS